jgi:hypothetical protein
VDIAWFGLRPAPRKRLVTVSADHLADERSGDF